MGAGQSDAPTSPIRRRVCSAEANLDRPASAASAFGCLRQSNRTHGPAASSTWTFQGDDVILTVSLGRVDGRNVVVTGSRRGVVGVWDSASTQRLATLTLDDSIDGVWAVAGADVVAALTPDGQLHMFDVTRGGHY